MIPYDDSSLQLQTEDVFLTDRCLIAHASHYPIPMIFLHPELLEQSMI